MPHKDPVAKAAYFREYRERNRAALVERGKQWRAENADILREKKKADYAANTEAYKARSKQSQMNRADEIKAHRRSAEYKGHRNADRKQWWATLPLWEKKYYAGLAQAYGRDHGKRGESLGLKEWYAKTFLSESVTCEYCSKVLIAANGIVDHKQPYRWGGLHEASNLAVTCADCNTMKGATPWEVWSSYLEKKRGAVWQ